MLLYWRAVRGNRRRWLLCVRSRTIDYSLHWKQKHHRVATPSFFNMVVEVEADWYRLLCPLSHCSSTATLESPFQTQRRTTQITLCPSFLAWITELTNVTKLLKKHILIISSWDDAIMMKKKRQLEATSKSSTLCSEQNNAADSLHIESRNTISDNLAFYNMLVQLEAVGKNWPPTGID